MAKVLSLRALLVATALSVATAAVPAYSKQTVGQKLDDTVIMTKVKATLVADPQTKARDIHVEVNNGRVQLNGFVNTDDERTHAAQITATVDGVIAVDNNLEVQKVLRTASAVIDDASISTKVKAALIADERTKAREISVETRQGVVLLGGFVTTDAERNAAGEIASGVSGVARVDNQIALK
jgi:hyperosmotically inducible protein